MEEIVKRPKVVKKVWGSEEWIVNTEEYCGKILRLKKGKRCSLHYHEIKDETFYILSGSVLMEYEGIKMLQSRDSLRILRGKLHRFSGLENSVIIEVSTHHEEEDSYRIVGQLSGNVPKDILKEFGVK